MMSICISQSSTDFNTVGTLLEGINNIVVIKTIQAIKGMYLRNMSSVLPDQFSVFFGRK